jgi:predicted small secreted protein
MQTYTVANEAKKRRKIQVVKMRGSHIDLSPRPYEITEKGIEVYSGEPVLES